jgi:hypothetical protein
MKIENIDIQTAEKLLEQNSPKGNWSKLLKEIEETGQPKRVTDLSRGQVSALIRAAKQKGFRAKGNYVEGSVVIAP